MRFGGRVVTAHPGAVTRKIHGIPLTRRQSTQGTENETRNRRGNLEEAGELQDPLRLLAGPPRHHAGRLYVIAEYQLPETGVAFA